MTDTPNYNDGNWHGWNGGECPVHPKTVVQAIRGNEEFAETVTWLASDIQDVCWQDARVPRPVIAFRVIKEHIEPREWWLMTENGIVRSQSSGVPDVVPNGWKCVHVREVIE